MRNHLLIAWLLVAVSACQQQLVFESSKSTRTQLHAQSPVDSATLLLVSPYKLRLDSQMNRIVAQTAEPLDRAQPEGALGNLVADALLEQSRHHLGEPVHCSIVNMGGIRLPSIPAGSITLGKVYELMPFDNQVVILEIPGDTLQIVCNLIAAKGGWPVAGLTMTIRDGSAVNVMVNGEALQPQHRYVVAISDYLANGGDNMQLLKQFQQRPTSILLRDMIIMHLESFTVRNQPVPLPEEGRVHVE
jgi:2',3'-cyclic-nucleotide 2'-phosphodiesterase (5'-nucleotidase family)